MTFFFCISKSWLNFIPQSQLEERRSGSQHITARLIKLHHTGNVLSLSLSLLRYPQHLPPPPSSPYHRRDTYPVVKGCGSVMGSLGVEAEFTCAATTSNPTQAFTFPLSSTCCCHLEKKNYIHGRQSWSRKEKKAVDLYGERSLWAKGSKGKVEDTKLSAGREVNCAFIGCAVICYHCVQPLWEPCYFFFVLMKTGKPQADSRAAHECLFF